MGYVYISKIYFDFLKRTIPHTTLALLSMSMSDCPGRTKCFCPSMTMVDTHGFARLLCDALKSVGEMWQ